VTSAFITCAVTGNGDTVKKSGLVPYAPRDIARDCIDAAGAGAAVVHVHVRDPITGDPSREVDYYREVVERVRQSDVDVVIPRRGVSASGPNPLRSPVEPGQIANAERCRR
jgi:uncharacterized protein (DUF849 family)